MERLYFIEKTHQYFGIETGLEYTPVSTVAHSYEAYTDWEAILVRKAEKIGITPEELQAQWDESKDVGTSVGTWVHNLKEERVFESGTYMDCDVVKYEMDGLKKLQVEGVDLGKCYPELILGVNKGHMRIGGQSDIVVVDAKGYVHIQDYKTDFKLDMFSYCDYHTREYKMFKAPLDRFMDCNWWAYTIKMNMYMFFMLHTYPHLKPGEITLIHLDLERIEGTKRALLDDKGEPAIKQERNYKLDLIQPDIKNMLNHYYKSTKAA